MTIKTTAAAALLLGAMIALPQAAMAGKPDRDPSEKDCPNPALETRCSAELDAAYDLIDYLYTMNSEYEVFLSRNAERDAGTLMCKVSGAEFKLDQGKDDEAIFNLDTAIAKIHSLYGQGKLSYEGLSAMEDAFNAAKSCIQGP